jgi:hypothetical protein
MKSNRNDIPSPTICFNCGSILQANDDNTGIDNVTGRRTVDDLSPMGGGIFDVFTSTTTTTRTTTTNEAGSGGINRKKETNNIIDVDVIDDDRPFQ